jgi:hypothetical protein
MLGRTEWIEAIEAAQFKRVEGGYVFTAPNPRLFGPARSYLVNEAQKADIAARLRRARRTIAPFVIVLNTLMIIGVAALAAFLLDYSLPTVTKALIVVVPTVVAMLVTMLVTIVPVQVYSERALRRLLAGLPQTPERITFRDRAETVTKVTSFRNLLGWGLFSFALGGLMVFNLLKYPDLVWLFAFGAVLFGLSAASFIFLAIVKAKLGRRASPN